MDSQRGRIIREELLRSIAWIGLGIVGWPILISEVAWLDATALTVFGLPVVTWASLTVGMIGVRLATGTEFQIQTTEGLDIVTVGGAVLGGFWAAFLIFVLDWSPLISIGLYIAVMAAYLVYYTRVVRPELSSPGED